MRGLDARLGALERACGVDGGPPFVVVFNASGASEADVQAAIRQATARNPGQRSYVVFMPPLEAQNEP